MITFLDAIHSLCPDALMVTGGVLITKWVDERTQPTVAEIDAEQIRLQAEYDGNVYQRTRFSAFADVREQLDLLYHDMAADKGDKTGEWFKAVKAVKDATPKP